MECTPGEGGENFLASSPSAIVWLKFKQNIQTVAAYLNYPIFSLDSIAIINDGNRSATIDREQNQKDCEQSCTLLPEITDQYCRSDFHMHLQLLMSLKPSNLGENPQSGVIQNYLNILRCNGTREDKLCRIEKTSIYFLHAYMQKYFAYMGKLGRNPLNDALGLAYTALYENFHRFLDYFLRNNSLYHIPESMNSIGEYIIHLQPNRESLLYKFLCKRFRLISKIYGADPTHCYEPHCSLTGFFRCPRLCAHYLVYYLRRSMELLRSRGLCNDHIPGKHYDRMQDDIPLCYIPRNRSDSSGGIMCTNDGYILISIRSDVATHLISQLQVAMSLLFSVNIRTKRCDHITLACQRHGTKVQENIASLYKPLLEIHPRILSDTLWDILVYRLDHKSQSYESKHQLTAVGRISIGQAIYT